MSSRLMPAAMRSDPLITYMPRSVTGILAQPAPRENHGVDAPLAGTRGNTLWLMTSSFTSGSTVVALVTLAAGGYVTTTCETAMPPGICTFTAITREPRNENGLDAVSVSSATEAATCPPFGLDGGGPAKYFALNVPVGAMAT